MFYLIFYTNFIYYLDNNRMIPCGDLNMAISGKQFDIFSGLISYKPFLIPELDGNVLISIEYHNYIIIIILSLLTLSHQ